MRKRAAERVWKQEGMSPATSIALQQLALPMMIASEAMKKGLLAFVQRVGSPSAIRAASGSGDR
jgi:hypothetical protein